LAFPDITPEIFGKSLGIGAPELVCRGWPNRAWAFKISTDVAQSVIKVTLMRLVAVVFMASPRIGIVALGDRS
jgi:hypothetical protein